MKRLLFISGFLILFATEILRIYFIMPFPGSQKSNTIDIAYFLAKYASYIRVIAILLILPRASHLFTQKGKWKKILLSIAIVLYAVIFYFFNFRFEADKMFYQPQHKNLAAVADNKIPQDKLVVGVVINGEAKAFPIQIIGYHHQVQDTIGGEPVIVTYCTVCRTGRAFSPIVNGKKEDFRLVGMDHFNAMFEDKSTKSWWRQATGEAIVGPLKGYSLRQIPSQQMTLAAWLREYPNSLILQQDTVFKEEYDDLADFDKGTIKGSLEKRDSASWKRKSWVIGVKTSGGSKAYDWNELVKQKLIEDSLPNMPLVILLEKDTASFHVWSRIVNGQSLHFVRTGEDGIKDINTNSIWNNDGVCVLGTLKDQKLTPIQASQEFWHSWQSFHRDTKQYTP